MLIRVYATPKAAEARLALNESVSAMLTTVFVCPNISWMNTEDPVSVRMPGANPFETGRKGALSR